MNRAGRILAGPVFDPSRPEPPSPEPAPGPAPAMQPHDPRIRMNPAEAATPTPTPAPYVHRSRVRVRYAETDRMGVVYHANYLVWCEIGRTDFIRATVASYASLEEEGVMLAVAECSIRFIRGAVYDDEVEVQTRLLRVRSRTLEFGYEIIHVERGERLATATTTLVRLEPTGRPSVIPESVRSALEPMVSAE